ncbi:membrane protein [Rhizocola hellebori]|uniref:Membrane protein n=2 Tax=Rhizocola hellebori TaxID=1392758 RepID=A0A8J3QJ35_9ACTN|nr:membrane protein [Rhizocola hellebori]
MVCENFRDELSARLDGEDDPANRHRADKHLAGCAACTAWWQRANELARLTRAAASQPVPTLSPQAMATVLAAAPVRTGAAKVLVGLRLALLAVGLGQFLLGLVQISSYATTLADNTHGGTGSVSSGHLWHESAAWNVAIGAALAWLAWRRNRPAALIPVMTAFVAVLGLLTANDALVGRVDGGRILSHGLVLAGYALLLVMNLPRLRSPGPPADAQTPGSHWTLRPHDDGSGPLAPVLPFPANAATAQRRRAA